MNGRFLVINCLKKARKLLKKEKSCTKSEKLLKSCRATYGQPYQLADLSKLRFWIPSSFQAGALHQHLDEWRDIIENPPSLQQMEVSKWFQHRVSVFHYFRYFKGNYKGVNYDSERPPTQQFKNNTSCRPFGDFIRRTLLERLATAAIAFVGRVGEVTPPYLVLPLTMEPTKPRLCHDVQFLNV